MVRTNKRILVIDDQENIRKDYETILVKSAKSQEIFDIENFLDDVNTVETKEESEEPLLSDTEVNGIDFEVDFADQGKKGYFLVQKALEENKPYAVAFIDMRMPPGWNGLETAKKIRSIDKEIEIVIVTAFADVPRNELVKEVGYPEKLLYLKKPFNAEEIEQLALNLTQKYLFLQKNKLFTNSLKKLIDNMKEIKTGVYDNYVNLLQSILTHILDCVGSKRGVIAIVNDSHVDFMVVSGNIDEHYKDIIGRINLHEINKYDLLEENILLLPISTLNESKDQILLFAIDGAEDIIKNNELVNILVDTAQDIFKNYILQKKYFEQEKLASIGLGADKIIHDLKNPLSVISGYAELMQAQLNYLIIDEKTKNKFNTFLEKILLTEGYMLNLLKDILDFSRNEVNLEKVNIKVDSLLNYIMDDLMIILDKNNVAFQNLLIDNVILNIDKNKFKRVFNNLISNAIQAFNDVNQQTERYIRITSELREDNTFIFSIFNNGPEIPVTIRKEIFRPFKTSGVHKGSGLGMAITKQIVESHGGSISFVTNEEGTTFIIKVPLEK